ncbi:DsbA family protein [Streptomyces tsukubensis]|uniref:Thioredoxin-like fold domain-containing protein n=1 Tax=Streptomyces tsukubensis TaxID=83656 RepID=A0A1V4A0K5_9ACTN|nr:thioredoxin domain-containing protein [Streptomyces tsukubensis]OON71753.1 hypothetical protein B1H18_32605 [Streptomyces tsukubensis]QFR93085.1 thioredoxin domain-containing protein [Streptomyces tsukubensis]
MSEKNREGKRAARERLVAEREREKTREKRRRVYVAGGSVVAALAVAGAVGVFVAQGSGGRSAAADGKVVVPKGASGEDGLAIPVGSPEAKSTLTVWEDFRCPACAQFENTYRSVVDDLVDKGSLKVEYHLATLIDKNMRGTGSRRAANAAVCAQDAGKFRPFHDVLYRNQPGEADDAYAKEDKLFGLAGQVPGLVTPDFKKCVQDGRHDGWVDKSDQAFQKGGFRGTPAVLLNGKDVFSDQKNPLTPAKLKQTVERAG